MEFNPHFASSRLISLMVSEPLLAQAEIYQAGEYTVTLDRNVDNGRTYYGCDAQQHCIYLTHGTTWQTQRYRGISWENKGYTYSVSWQEGTSEQLYLKVFNSQGRMILNLLMLRKF